MSIQFYDFQPNIESYYPQIIKGLQEPLKTLPNMLMYDEEGEALFDQICNVPEYYPSRTEMAIMTTYIGEMVDNIGENCLLVEYGSGSSIKTRLLLDHLPHLAGYVPIDMSKEHLLKSATRIAEDYPQIEIIPVCADFTQSFDIPSPQHPVNRQVAYCPGISIANLHPPQAIKFLDMVRQRAGSNGGLLLSVDLKKEPRIIENAYNDSQGIGAKFNMNILNVINRIAGADFQLEQFRREATYNEASGRMEMHLISLQDQIVHVGDYQCMLQQGEPIWMEFSYKYGLEEFSNLASKSGWRVEQVWLDDRALLSIQYLTA